MEKIFYSLNSFQRIIEDVRPSSIALLTSKEVLSACDWAEKQLKPYCSFIVKIPDGEQAKEWNVVHGVVQKFLEEKSDRKTLLVALGGGTIGDVGGFTASIWKRGIPFVNIPTTLLAQADSCIGGKTGINFQGYKNQIGTFYEPKAIIIDAKFLETLSDEHIINGLGEIIKVGFLRDPNILESLKRISLSDLRNAAIVEPLIQKAISVKLFFVKQDPNDTGIRQVLNFGHTVGHAIELSYGIGHGRAVLIGMKKELQIGERLGISGPEILTTLNEILDHLGIELSEDERKIDRNTLMQDKKFHGGILALPVLSKIGEARIEDINRERIEALFD